MRKLPVVATLFAALTACGGDDDGDTTGTGGSGASTSTGGTTATGGSSATGGGGGAGGGSCDDAPFVAEAEDAGTFQGVFRYIAQSTLGAPVDVLSFELLDGAPAMPSAIPLTGDGYESCTTCVVLYLGCDQNLANCQQTFLAQSGTLDVTSTGDSGATFAGTLDNVELVEVSIDPNTFVSTPVQGGETVCWASYAFSAPIQ
jgi:hypothetical protein